MINYTRNDLLQLHQEIETMIWPQPRHLLNQSLTQIQIHRSSTKHILTITMSLCQEIQTIILEEQLVLTSIKMHWHQTQKDEQRIVRVVNDAFHFKNTFQLWKTNWFSRHWKKNLLYLSLLLWNVWGKYVQQLKILHQLWKTTWLGFRANTKRNSK